MGLRDSKRPLPPLLSISPTSTQVLNTSASAAAEHLSKRLVLDPSGRLFGGYELLGDWLGVVGGWGWVLSVLFR